MNRQAPPRLGWVGLGAMGLAMAENLQKHLKGKGAPALGYNNRTMSRGEPLQQNGGVPHNSIGELVQSSDIVFISLSDDAALENVVAQILSSGIIAGKIFADTSTVHPNTSLATSKSLSNAGATFVASPVFGASPAAVRGTILFAIAGPLHAVEKISPFITGVMGRGAIRLGEDPVKASLLKTAGNFIIAGLMEIIAEALVFAEKSGLGCDNLEELIRENFGEAAYSDSRRMTTGEYAPAKGQQAASDLNLAIKDVEHGITCAKSVDTRLEVADVVLSHLKQAKQYADSQGGRTLDSSSMYGVLRQASGLDFDSDLVKARDA